MPVPLLAPLLGSLVASSMPAIGAGVATALGGAAATGIGSLIASAAPAAIGAGIGTLAAGGNPGEALANAATFGLGGAALGGLGAGAGAAATGAGTAGGAAVSAAPAAAARTAGAAAARTGAAAAGQTLNPLTALQLASQAGIGGGTTPAPMPQPEVRRGQPSQAAPSVMSMLPQQAPTPNPQAMVPQTIQPAGYYQQSAPPMSGMDMTGQGMTYPMGGIGSAMMQRGMQPFMLADGGYVEGPGTGRSDSIPAKIYQDGVPVQEARLSDGEFVMTERAVRGAGGGDRAKGAAKMYRMMKEFERGGRV